MNQMPPPPPDPGPGGGPDWDMVADMADDFGDDFDMLIGTYLFRRRRRIAARRGKWQPGWAARPLPPRLPPGRIAAPDV